MPPDEPDLTAELDDAEEIVFGTVAEVVTEWGVRYDYDDPGHNVRCIAIGEQRAEDIARCIAADHHAVGQDVTVVKRTIRIGEWEDA
jgi:hypothetical protein